jgi:hypothetical protein
MTDSRVAWQAVGDRMSALALKLKLHAKEELSEAELGQRAGFDKIAKAVEETFDALGDAAEDEAVREDVREAARAVVAALEATVQDVRRGVTGS